MVRPCKQASILRTWERMPFCPCLEANLSPIIGLRLMASVMVTFCGLLLLPPLDSIATCLPTSAQGGSLCPNTTNTHLFNKGGLALVDLLVRLLGRLVNVLVENVARFKPGPNLRQPVGVQVFRPELRAHVSSKETCTAQRVLDGEG